MTGDQALAVLELLGDLLNAGRAQAVQLAECQGALTVVRGEAAQLSTALGEALAPPVKSPPPRKRVPAKRAAVRRR